VTHEPYLTGMAKLVFKRSTYLPVAITTNPAIKSLKAFEVSEALG